MKCTFKIFLILVISSSLAFPQLMKETNTQGLYFDTSYYGRFIPADGVLDTAFYYRLPLSKSTNYAFRNTKIDFGIKNTFGLHENIVSAFIDIKPFGFFSLKLSGGYISYYNIIDHFGFSSYSNSQPWVNLDNYQNRVGESASGYVVEVNPVFSFDIYKFTLIADLKISYMEMDKGPFFYDNTSFLIRKQSDFSYLLNAYLLFNIFPINVGIHYRINHTQFANNLGQMLGAVGVFDYYFSERFNIYAILHIGEYLDYEYFTGQLFIDLEFGVRYRIF